MIRILLCCPSCPAKGTAHMEPDQLAFFRVETASSFLLFGLGRSHIAAVALLCEQRIQHTSQHLDPSFLSCSRSNGEERTGAHPKNHTPHDLDPQHQPPELRSPEGYVPSTPNLTGRKFEAPPNSKPIRT